MEGMLWIIQAAFQEEGTLHGASLDRESLVCWGGAPKLPLLHPSQGLVCPQSLPASSGAHSLVFYMIRGAVLLCSWSPGSLAWLVASKLRLMGCDLFKELDPRGHRG